MRIGIDIMGGDFAPKKTVHGAILALKELPNDTEIVLFGRESEIFYELEKYNISADKYQKVEIVYNTGFIKKSFVSIVQEYNITIFFNEE